MNRLTRSLQLALTAVLAILIQAHSQQQPRPAPVDASVAFAAAVEQPTLKFAILGDTGTGGKPQYEVARRLAEAHATFPFEFVILLGDNMYGGESASDFKNKFEKPYDALLQKGVKFYASLGNHDRPERAIAYKPFNMGGKRYYTFRPMPGIRFFALDSNYMDRAQIEWLESELKSSGSEWKILFFHHPLYSSGEKHGSSIELRKVLEPLLIRHGADVVFAGHEHFYERLKPQNGIEYFILGSSAKLRKGNISPKSAITAKGYDTDNAFMMAEVAGDGMNYHAISRTGKVVDTGSFIRAELRDGKK
jgi:predicted MPP superfamily phosphohydrolase